MWADDTNYTVIKNGIVVVSGTGPAIRVDGNKLVIRDGPKETQPLALTRGEASRKLRHIMVCGHAGGFVTFDALRWLRDTGVAFSQLDWDGAVIIASGPRGPDRPALRRAQVLICSGVMPETAIAVAREILRAKLAGQAEVARLMERAEASAAIAGLAADIARETAGPKLLTIEAKAAAIYWREWATVPVRFARDNPQRLDHKGRWRPGRAEGWSTFGTRVSMLTGRPWRASTPGNAVLNFLFGIARTEMTIALLAAGLDPGIGLFHADDDGRPSLALDGLEAVRPYIEAWCLAFLAATAFANRDFHEMADGEIRLTHPLAAHLAHTAALWRPACERVAGWMARAFGGAVRLPAPEMNAAGASGDHLRQTIPAVAGPPITGNQPPPLPRPLPMFVGPAHGYGLPTPRGGLRGDAVPRTCWECGRAIAPIRRNGRFCSASCAGIYHAEMHKLLPIENIALPAAQAAAKASEELRKRRLSRSISARLQWERANRVEIQGNVDTRTAAQRAGLQGWYDTEMRPRLSALRTIDVSRTLDISRVYARKIVRGEQMPHPRHFAALAELAGVPVPKGFSIKPHRGDW